MMDKQYKTSAGFRDWSKEEMNVYLDYDQAENQRINKRVTLEV
jgi:hypothetical protein